MSTNEKSVSTAITTEPAASSARYTDTVQGRILELRRWREEIPRFVIPTTDAATQRLSTAASLPPEFIELTNVAVVNQTALVRGDGVPPEEVRDLVAYADAHDPLVDELEVLVHFLRYSIATARNTAGTEALTTYSLAQRLAKRPKYAHLKPYVADMRRALGRGRKLTLEQAAQKAAERAAKAAAKLAKRTAQMLPPASETP